MLCRTILCALSGTPAVFTLVIRWQRRLTPIYWTATSDVYEGRPCHLQDPDIRTAILHNLNSISTPPSHTSIHQHYSHLIASIQEAIRDSIPRNQRATPNQSFITPDTWVAIKTKNRLLQYIHYLHRRQIPIDTSLLDELHLHQANVKQRSKTDKHNYLHKLAENASNPHTPSPKHIRSLRRKDRVRHRPPTLLLKKNHK